MISKNIQLGYDGYTNEEENISGSSKWYFTNEGNWFWSGGVVENSIPDKIYGAIAFLFALIFHCLTFIQVLN